jgi:hypothetical protein
MPAAPEAKVRASSPVVQFQKLHEIGEIATNNAFSLEKPIPQVFLWILACEWVLKKFCHPIPRVYSHSLSLKCLLPLLEKSRTQSQRWHGYEIVSGLDYPRFSDEQ